MIRAIAVPLARIADFQTAWYLAILLSGMLALFAYGVFHIVAALRPLWRTGNQGLAVLLVSVTLVTTLLFVSMTLMAAISLWPSSIGGVG